MRQFLFLVFLTLLSPIASAQCFFYLLEVQTDYSTLPEQMFPGDVVSLSIPIENTTDACQATEVVAEIALNENYFEADDFVEKISIINSKEIKTAVFKLKVKESTLPGSYKFSVKLTYFSGSNVAEETFELPLEVLACYSLDVENVSYSSSSVYAGEEIKIFADLKNTCFGIARDVRVELKPVTNQSFDPFILLSSNFLQLGDILPGRSAPVSFSLKPIGEADPKVFVFRIDANCFDCKTTFSDTISFEVLAKPELIFSGIDFSNETRVDAKSIFVGDSFSFSVQVDNIGKKTAKAVKVRLEIGDEIAGSKQDFVGNIDADDSGAAIFNLAVLPAAKVGSHDAIIVVEFIDELGKTQTVNEKYSFFVNQLPLDIGGLIFLLFLVAVILVILYFIIKMVFRQLALRKVKLR